MSRALLSLLPGWSRGLMHAIKWVVEPPAFDSKAANNWRFLMRTTISPRGEALSTHLGLVATRKTPPCSK